MRNGTTDSFRPSSCPLNPRQMLLQTATVAVMEAVEAQAMQVAQAQMAADTHHRDLRNAMDLNTARVFVRDLDAAKQFYSRKLGLQLTADG